MGRTMLDFLSTFPPKQPLHNIKFSEGSITFQRALGKDVIKFGLRAQEEGREAGSFLRFLTALPSSCRELDIYSADQLSAQEVSALFNGIASSTCTSLQTLSVFREITLATANSTQSFGALLGDALCRNTSLTELEISSKVMINYEEHLLPALLTRSRGSSPLKSLIVLLHDHVTLDCVHKIFAALALNTLSGLADIRIHSVLKSKQAICKAQLWHDECKAQLGTMLCTNSSLRNLDIWDCYLPGTLVHSLFNSLQNNLTLTDLSLSGSYGEDWPSASSVLDCLRLNASLQFLHLDKTPLAGNKEAAIQALLERNREKHLELFRTENARQVQPTTARLFLCGFPYSGKTTLASSLRRKQSKLSSLLSHSSSSVKRRTRGIEVSMLKNYEVKVSLWDLAGQDQYHAFHDNMFPNLSSEATPSLFLFVWNPILLDETNGQETKGLDGQIQIKTLDMFKQEFSYWLKFIASKTLASSKFQPKLLVAVTRADRLLSRAIHLRTGAKNWLKNTFNQCQEEFKEYIQIDMDQGYFEMDARKPNQVEALAHHIFQCAQNVLDSAPLVYEACDDARRVISDLVHEKHGADPVIKKEEFFSLLKQHLYFTSKEIREAIALSLNDSGDLIYFQSSDLVVLDTQWFCQEIMGNLLYFKGSDFHASEDHGSFSLEVLKELLESKLNSTSHAKFSKFRYMFPTTSSTKVEGETLVELLIGLRLACRQDNSSNIFIPATLCSKNQIQIHPSQYFKDLGNITTYMGRRLKCKDSTRTFFTPGIFHLLQVTFREMFSTIRVNLQEDIIAFSRDGVNVFAEFSKLHGIDILILSGLNTDDTIEWVSEQVINNMERICAQPRGIPGVELSCEVVNPHWVESICVCMEDKGKAEAVPMEELRGALKRYLDKKGFEPKHLKNILYTWQTTNKSSCVIDLLGNVETLRLIESYERTFIIDVEDALGVNMEKAIADPIEQEEKVFSSSIDGKERKWIYNKLEEVHKDIQRMDQDLQNIKENISSLCNAAVPKLQKKMDEMLTFAKEGEAGKLPRLFVLTSDVGLVRKIIATMVPSLQNVRLELLCEHRREPHLVDGQPGLIFATLEDGLLKRGLPYIITFLKVAQVAVKVGVHAATGLGQFIPDFVRVVASIEATPQTPNFPTNFESDSLFKSRTNFQEGQQWLLDVLSKHHCCTSTQIHDMFRLNRVRYPDLQVRWLCDKHRCEGELCPI